MIGRDRNQQRDAGRVEQYKSYVQDLGNMGTRHENARRFYVTVVSAFFAFLALSGENGPLKSVEGPVQMVVGLVGIALSLVWVVHMVSFRAIYRAKFDVLRIMERRQGLFHTFDEEWKILTADRRYRYLTLIDSAFPVFFAALFVALLLLKLPIHGQ